MSRLKSIILIDGKNCCYRQGYGHSSLWGGGQPTGVLYGCLVGLLSMANHFPDVPAVWVWDGEGQTWRHRLTKGVYKENRVNGGRPPDEKPNEAQDELRQAVYAQVPQLKRILRKLGLRQFEVAGLEGDDLIGIMTTKLLEEKLTDEVIIHSSDKDFYQLVNPKVRVLKNFKEGEPQWAKPKEIEEEFKIKLESWTRFRAIIGDPSDNIPRLFKGVGPVTAAGFLQEGLDASAERFEDLPKEVQRRFTAPRVIRKNPVDVRREWLRVHTNYRLCQIVRACDSKELSDDVKKSLKALLGDLRTKDLRRKDRGDDAWREFTALLHKYEMRELLSRRSEFWQLV